MKTKEFKKKVEELGYNIEISGADLLIKRNEWIFAIISRTSPYTMSTYTTFGVKHANELLDLCVEYAKTPIEEREEEEKFYLQKIKSFYEVKIDKDNMFLILDMDDNSFFLSDVQFYDKYIRGNFKTKFTQQEIDEIKKKYNTDLKEFKQIAFS